LSIIGIRLNRKLALPPNLICFSGTLGLSLHETSPLQRPTNHSTTSTRMTGTLLESYSGSILQWWLKQAILYAFLTQSISRAEGTHFPDLLPHSTDYRCDSFGVRAHAPFVLGKSTCTMVRLLWHQDRARLPRQTNRGHFEPPSYMALLSLSSSTDPVLQPC
jgi:hypothetical protein